jgi:hypothetical protein
MKAPGLGGFIVATLHATPCLLELVSAQANQSANVNKFQNITDHCQLKLKWRRK